MNVSKTYLHTYLYICVLRTFQGLFHMHSPFFLRPRCFMFYMSYQLPVLPPSIPPQSLTAMMEKASRHEGFYGFCTLSISSVLPQQLVTILQEKKKRKREKVHPRIRVAANVSFYITINRNPSVNRILHSYFPKLPIRNDEDPHLRPFETSIVLFGDF